MTPRSHACPSAVPFAISIVLGLGSVHAATLTWDGGGANGNWDTAANWNPDATPPVDPNHDYIFAGSLNLAVNNNQQTAFRNITFSAGAGAFTLSGNDMTWTYGGTTASPGSATNNSTNLQTINFNISMPGTRQVNAASGDLAMGGILSGAGSIHKLGANTLTLSGNNTFAGAMVIREGKLSIATINNASSAGVLGNSANAVTLGYTGGLTGTLSYTGADASSTKRFTMGTGGTGNFEVTNGATTLTLSGLIDGSGNLTKTGAGTLTFSATNHSYTGSTTISSGTLKLASGTGGTQNNIASSLNIFIGNGATLDTTGLVNSSTSAAFNLSSGQSITGTGATGFVTTSTGGGVAMLGNNTISSSGTLTLTRLVALNTNGTTNAITGGSIVTGTASSRGLVIGSNAAGTLTISGGSLTSQASGANNDVLGNGAAGSGTLVVGGGAGSASFVNTTSTVQLGNNSGHGTLTLLNNGSATIGTLQFNTGTQNGTVNLDGGVLTLSNLTVSSGTSKVLNFNGGTLRAGASTLAVSGLNEVNVKDGGAIIDTNNFNVSIGNALLNFAGATTDTLTKSGTGTLTLSGVNTYTGATTINGGVIKAGNAAALGATTSGTTVNTNGTFDFNGVALNAESFNLAGGKLTNTGAEQINAISGAATVTADSSIGGTNRWDFRATGASLTVNNGVILAKVDANTIATVGRTVTNNGTIRIDAGAFGLHTAGTYGGTGNYVVNSGGELQLGSYGSPVTLGNAITSNGGTLSSVESNGGASDFSGNISLTAATTTTLRADALGVISGSISGNGNLTKTGSSTFTLSGDNSYTGTTNVTGGVLTLNHPNALGASSSITVNTAGTLRVAVPNSTSTNTGAGRTVTIHGIGASFYGALQGADSISATWAGNVVIGSTGARIGAGSGGTLTVDGVISEASAGSAVLFSRAPNSTTVLNNVNTYTGDTQFYMNSSTTTLKMGVANAINSASRVTISSTTSGTGYLDLNGHNQNIRALDDTVGGDLVVTNNSTLANDDAVLTLSESNAANTATFGGWIQDGATNKVSLVKTGAGTQVLSNTNTYTGTTTVSGGVLTISGTGSLAAGSAVSVESTATLHVAGVVNGTVNVQAGGTLNGNLGTFNGSVTIDGIHSPGTSPGLQTFTSGLTYGSTAVLNAEFVGNALGLRGTDYDGINVSGGDLLIDSASVFALIASGVDYTTAPWDSNRDFIVIDFSGGGSSTGLFTLNTTSAGSFASEGSWSLSNSNNDIVLSWTAVPEPRVALLGGLGLLGLLRRRRAA